MKHLVIGMGEIGSAVATVLSGAGYDVQTKDIEKNGVEGKIDVLHICIPYSDDFINIVKGYQKEYHPKSTIIYSTLLVGTTAKIKGAVHSPVEGKHPRLASSIKMGLRWIGYNDAADKIIPQKIWGPITVYESVESSDWTEFLKLASTSKYGINIVWAEYMDAAADSMGMPYKYVKEWDQAYNQLYRKLRMPSFQKFVLDPPLGKIGGHCVVPNAFLLDAQFPHKMLKLIKEMS